MFRKLLLCTVASAALPGHVALAANLPLKAPPPPATAWSWAGFYLGAHGGYGWGSNSFSQVLATFPAVAVVDSVNSGGWLAGGHAGYNWQNGRWVAGVEVDGSATGVRGDSAPVVRDLGGGATQTIIVSNDVKYLGTARLRAGVVPSANADVLLYATAGLAWERINRTNTTITVQPPTSVQTFTQPNDRFGWVAGVGGEFRLGATNWTARVEYLHYDFGMIEAGAQFTILGQTFINRGGRHAIDVVRGGISYKFDQPSAPLSAYAAYVAGRAAPPPMAWSWAGFYLGTHGGHGWARNDFTLHSTAPPPIQGVASVGWLAGAHAGYNWQYGRWVTGFEVDGSRAWIHGDTAAVVVPIGPSTISAGDHVNYLGTVRARFGAAPLANADVLLYGTAGLAWERFTRSDHSDVGGFIQSHGTAPRDHFGWVVGAGGEFRLGATNWIGRVEYLHYDFGTVERVGSNVSNPADVFFDYTDKAGRHTVDVVRGGVSYKFGPDGAPSSAYAAYASAAPAMSWSWAGYYLGAHAGHGWGRNDFSKFVFDAPVAMSSGIDSGGWVAGGQAGYNWQFDRWVAGLELDGSASRIRGAGTPLTRVFQNGLVQTAQHGDEVKYLGTLRGRVGGVPFINADLLLYGTAGLAWERLDRTVNVDSSFGQTSTRNYTITPRNHFGWVAGAGGEFRLGATNWIGRVEYLHYDFGTVESRAVGTGGFTEYAENGGRQTIDVVRGGVSYKFGTTP